MSTKNILATASRLISNNNSRVGKKLWSDGNSGDMMGKMMEKLSSIMSDNSTLLLLVAGALLLKM